MKMSWKMGVAVPTLLAAVGVATAAPETTDSMLRPLPLRRTMNSVQLSELPALLEDFGPEGARIETTPLSVIKPAFCFDPQNPPPPDVIAKVNAATQGYMSRYNVGNRWSGTVGSPITLTWSFVPDGVEISAGIPDIGEISRPSNLFARMDDIFGGTENRDFWISIFQIAFDRWEQLSGVTYVRVTAPGVPWDDGAAWGWPAPRNLIHQL